MEKEDEDADLQKRWGRKERMHEKIKIEILQFNAGLLYLLFIITQKAIILHPRDKSQAILFFKLQFIFLKYPGVTRVNQGSPCKV